MIYWRVKHVNRQFWPVIHLNRQFRRVIHLTRQFWRPNFSFTKKNISNKFKKVLKKFDLLASYTSNSPILASYTSNSTNFGDPFFHLQKKLKN